MSTKKFRDQRTSSRGLNVVQITQTNSKNIVIMISIEKRSITSKCYRPALINKI